MSNVYPVSKSFSKQLNSIRKQTYNSDHAVKGLNNRRYWKQYSLIASTAIDNPKLFKKFYDNKVILDICH